MQRSELEVLPIAVLLEVQVVGKDMGRDYKLELWALSRMLYPFFVHLHICHE
jgi:hypothetical protein